MARHCQATERASLRRVRTGLNEARAHLDRTLQRLRAAADIPPDARFLDLGAAQGRVLIAAGRMGLRAVGIEPYAPAREQALVLAKELNQPVDIRPGRAERLEFPDASFDLVHALSVLEHVADPAAVFAEVFRVLRPGGVFWFCTTNGLSPRQNEIAVFPCFGWYPNRLRRRIMRWTVSHRPAWIGHTDTPAMHWFTPGKTRAMLHEAGFGEILDRWDLRRDEEGGRRHGWILRWIRRKRWRRYLADIWIPASIYAAMKPVVNE
ncbi:MAG: class I SAM-dependent methyltransferase [Phycisphaerae bacterium]|nr:class I SAM-dependent methyltransferase [Phycisphaerae bacterium]